MAQFEYVMVALSSKDMENIEHCFTDKLNNFGKEGWELVSVITKPCLGGSQYNLLGITQKNIFVLKREIVKSEVSPV